MASTCKRTDWFLWLVFTFALNLNLQLFAIDDHGRELRPTSWQQDATINDVFFVSPTHGWAVGNQGLILRTTNGGRDWQTTTNAGLDLDDHRSLEDKLFNMRPVTQSHELYPLTCSLKSVFFLDQNKGWIVGNYYTPLLERSHSVMLRTDDGGESWRTVKSSFMPQINRIHFQDVLGGWALGRSGSLYKSGVFTTSSGGSNWTSQSIDPVGSWLDGDLVPSGFVVIDDEGKLGKITGKKFGLASVSGRQPGKMRSLRMQNARRGWAVGSAGTILTTSDGGHSWQRPVSLDTSSERLKHFDFESVTLAGNRVWIAGNPGSFVVSLNAASGADVQFHRMPGSAPVSKLSFADNKHGWAVGAGGMIVATTDGGTSWEIQRQANERVGILATSLQAADLPFAFISSFASEKGIITSSVIVNEQDELQLAIAASAANRVGCCTNLPLRIDQTDGNYEPDNTNRELERLVRTIRTLKPNVLVCSSVSDGSQKSNSKFELLCRNAIQMAADLSYFPSQLEATCLSAWQVDRFLIRTKSSTGDLNLDGKRYLPMSGTLLEDQIAISRGLVGLSPVYRETESYRIESFNGSVSARQEDILFGLKQLGRQVPTRKDHSRHGNLGSIASAPLKHKQLNQLINGEIDSPEKVAEIQRQIRTLGNGQEARELGIWLWQLADGFLEAGKVELAAFSLEQLVSRVSNHSLSPAALMWLTNYYSSSEFGTSIYSDFEADAENQVDLDEIDLPVPTQLVESTTTNEGGVQKVAWHLVDSDSEDSTVSTEEQIKNSISISQKARVQLASRYLTRLKQRDPDLAHSEEIQFMEASLSKKIPGDFSRENLLKKIRRTGPLSSSLAYAAGRELRTGEKQFVDNVPACFPVHTRPYLDGNLDDDLWQNAIENGNARLHTMNPTHDKQTARTDTTWLAYDHEFLFFAARCSHDAGPNVKNNHSPRTRDPDLRSHERVQLALDFDRDLQSEFLFEIDCNGRAAESCGGAVGWNPDWYVAASQTDRAWTIECAIPLNELTTRPVDETTLVALSCRRLNGDSIDLWSTGNARRSQRADMGIVAGLKIRPKRFEFLRFASLQNEDDVDAQLK